MQKEKTAKTAVPGTGTSLLGRVDSPADLAAFGSEDLVRLAAEVREAILEVVSRNGGHLASNLGAVELTIALHYVFHGPGDRIVWDVGHQSYTHKLLTGRREAFATLRMKGGLSGFPKRAESPYDVFDVGHSGTSISAALGIARARDHRKEEGTVVAVIGDGSMTAGLAFEGLNQAGILGERMVVVLNDNEMSISPNVGAMSSYLSRIFTGEFVTRTKKATKTFMERFHILGPKFLKAAKRAEESVKALVYPGMIFEELGYEYIGPVDGHHLDKLVESLQAARRVDGPVLVHVRTVKGKGYEPAERDPASFHGIGPFDRATGKPPAKAGPPSYTRVFSDALIEAARRDPRVIAITAAMAEGTGLDRFAREFPDRFYDVGIAEQHAVTFAAGLASRGFRPVVAVYSTFLQRAYDQVVQDVALQNLPVVLAMDRGGLVGEDGPTHHGAFDLSFLRHVPNLTLMVPRDEGELRRALATSFSLSGPSAFRYPRGTGTGVDLPPMEPWPLGKGELLRRGEDVALAAVGVAVPQCLAAAVLLAEKGVEAAVLDARFVKPLDVTLLAEWGERCGVLVTVEENALAGGFGSAVLEGLRDTGEEIAVHRLGLPDRFVGQGNQAELRAELGLDAPGIARSVLEWLKANR